MSFINSLYFIFIIYNRILFNILVLIKIISNSNLLFLIVLLIHVKDFETGQLLTDYVWLKNNSEFRSLHVKQGEKITFRATVTCYKKG
jgi:hypothetical protein